MADERHDLHAHTVASDGLRSVQELAMAARRIGLTGIAITDHDVLPDPAALRVAEQLSGVRLHLGVELSTRWEGRGYHLLGYGFDPANGALLEATRRRQAARQARFDRLRERIGELGARLDPRCAGSSLAPGRLHLARELVRQRHAGSVRAAFERYLRRIDGADDDLLDLSEAISLLRAAGGVAVLAHPPANLLHDEWRRLAGLGLDGLECRFPRAKRSHRRFLIERAAEYDLAHSAGSDYHGDEARFHLGLESVTRAELDSLLARGG